MHYDTLKKQLVYIIERIEDAFFEHNDQVETELIKPNYS